MDGNGNGSPVQPGATCRLGNGKTVWEIISFDGRVELSALGRGGYVNRTVSPNEITKVQPQRLEWPLYLVLNTRAVARTAAHELWDRLRFTNPDDVRQLAHRAETTAASYASVCENHSRELAALGIEEG